MSRQVLLATPRARARYSGTRWSHSKPRLTLAQSLGPFDDVRITLGGDGTIEVITGAASVGQGIETVMAQICADGLDTGLDRIRVIHGQTDRIARGMGAFASRVTVMTGAAVTIAAEKLRGELLRVAGRLLQTAPDRLAVTDDRVVVCDPSGGPSLVVGGTYQFLPRRPFILRKGPAGVVTALGPDVTALCVGDRVPAMAEQGGYADAVALRADQCYRLPPRMSFLEAASLSLVYDTAWFGLRERARLVPGETVLVLGASGGVGRAAVQLARAIGAHVLAGVARPERRAVVHAAGAHAVIDLSGENLRDTLREQVYAANDGRGADIILDPLGGTVFSAALRALA